MVVQLMAVFVLFYAITHPEVLNEAAGNPMINIQEQNIDNNNNALNAKLANSQIIKLDEGKPQLVKVDEATGQIIKVDDQPLPLPTPLARRQNGEKSERIFYAKNEVIFFTQKRIQSGDAHLALGLLFGLFTISAMLIYGAAKSRPLYLLPFFCFQVFDFVLACLTALGHYTWLPNLRELIENTPDFPFREQLLQVNAQWLALCVSCMYIVLLMVKAYFIGVVWACYQYLHARNAGVYSYTDEGDGIRRDAELLLPPDYENATKLPPVYQGPPPPYHQV